MNPDLLLTHAHALAERALVHSGNPALLRLLEGKLDVEHVAQAYLPHTVHLGPPFPMREGIEVLWGRPLADSPLDAAEPGTARMLPVLLALAIGLDPGVMGLGCSWTPSDGGWILTAGRRSRLFTASTRAVDLDPERCIYAPDVANERNIVQAVVRACLHILGVNGATLGKIRTHLRDRSGVPACGNPPPGEPFVPSNPTCSECKRVREQYPTLFFTKEEAADFAQGLKKTFVL